MHLSFSQPTRGIHPVMRSLATLLSGLCISSSILSGCSATTRAGSPISTLKVSSSNKPQPVFDRLQDGHVYLILISAYSQVIELSTLALGSQSKYGHIELVYNGLAYGCRPPSCGAMRLHDLATRFAGKEYTVREMHATNVTSGLKTFNKHFKGQKYDFLYRNCTDAVYQTLAVSGVPALPDPLSVAVTYAERPALRDFMEANVILLPDRKAILFPDQFLTVGVFTGEGKF